MPITVNTHDHGVTTGLVFGTVNQNRASRRGTLAFVDSFGTNINVQFLQAIEASSSETNKKVLRQLTRASDMIPVPAESGLLVQEELSAHLVVSIGPKTRALLVGGNATNVASLEGQIDQLVRVVIATFLGDASVAAAVGEPDHLHAVRDALVGNNPIDTFTGAYGGPV